jgi:hypothetical protein
MQLTLRYCIRSGKARLYSNAGSTARAKAALAATSGIQATTSLLKDFDKVDVPLVRKGSPQFLGWFDLAWIRVGQLRSGQVQRRGSSICC